MRQHESIAPNDLRVDDTVRASARGDKALSWAGVVIGIALGLAVVQAAPSPEQRQSPHTGVVVVGPLGLRAPAPAP